MSKYRIFQFEGPPILIHTPTAKKGMSAGSICFDFSLAGPFTTTSCWWKTAHHKNLFLRGVTHYLCSFAKLVKISLDYLVNLWLQNTLW